jgi:hypothetical protein
MTVTESSTCGCGAGFMLLQGPPGTGKTMTVVGMLNTLHLTAYDGFRRLLAWSVSTEQGQAGEEEEEEEGEGDEDDGREMDEARRDGDVKSESVYGAAEPAVKSESVFVKTEAVVKPEPVVKAEVVVKAEAVVTAEPVVTGESVVVSQVVESATKPRSEGSTKKRHRDEGGAVVDAAVDAAAPRKQARSTAAVVTATGTGGRLLSSLPRAHSGLPRVVGGGGGGAAAAAAAAASRAATGGGSSGGSGGGSSGGGGGAGAGAGAGGSRAAASGHAAVFKNIMLQLSKTKAERDKAEDIRTKYLIAPPVDGGSQRRCSMCPSVALRLWN